MDWLLAALAIFNLVSMITVFSPRAVPRRSVPWAVFGTALLATELAWIWLPLQVILAWLLIDAGALDSGLGVAALLVLLATWPGLVWSIRQSTLAENTVEQALQADLGPEYRGDIPAAIEGARDPEAGDVLVRALSPLDAAPDDVLAAGVVRCCCKFTAAPG